MYKRQVVIRTLQLGLCAQHLGLGIMQVVDLILVQADNAGIDLVTDEVINSLLYCCIGVEITAILYTDALQIVLQRVALEMVGTIEGKVLQEVSQTALVIILIDRTHFLSRCV